MKFKKLFRSNKGISSVLSILLITGIMITSVALTYSYIIPTIERARLRSTLSTTSLFMTKMDNTIQSLMYDGVGAVRNLEIDAFAGRLDFRTFGLNVRAFIDGALYFPIPGLIYGIARLDIPSDTAILGRNTIQYIKGGVNYPYVVTDTSSNDPAMITLQRTEAELYRFELWYRVLLHVRDTGVGGTIDISLVVFEFQSSDSISSLNTASYCLAISKIGLEVNPDRYGFVDGQPIITSGENFYLTINKGVGPKIVYSSNGVRTQISFNVQVINLAINILELS